MLCGRQTADGSDKLHSVLERKSSPAEELTILRCLKIFLSFLVMGKCLSVGSDWAKPFQGLVLSSREETVVLRSIYPVFIVS